MGQNGGCLEELEGSRAGAVREIPPEVRVVSF